MGNFIWIIIVFVVISLISSAVKKNAQKSKDAEDKQAPPEPRAVRPPVMSDIQRAFQLMSEFDEQQPQKADQKVEFPFVSSSYPEDVVSPEGTYGQSDGSASYEGTQSYGNGAMSTQGRYAHEGVRVHNAPITTMQAGYSSTLSETYNKRVSSGQNMYAKSSLNEISNRFEKDTAFSSNAPKRSGGLVLFDNKNEYVKAVVYSEILSRKTARR